MFLHMFEVHLKRFLPKYLKFRHLFPIERICLILRLTYTFLSKQEMLQTNFTRHVVRSRTTMLQECRNNVSNDAECGK